MRAASRVTGARTVWSDVAGEPAAALCVRLGALGIDRLRLLGDDVDTDGHDIRLAAHAAGVSVDDAPSRGCSRDRATEVGRASRR